MKLIKMINLDREFNEYLNTKYGLVEVCGEKYPTDWALKLLDEQRYFILRNFWMLEKLRSSDVKIIDGNYYKVGVL
jgi:hypothetical protein